MCVSVTEKNYGVSSGDVRHGLVLALQYPRRTYVWPSRLKVTLNFCHILPGDRTIVQKIFGLNTTDYDSLIFCLWPTHTIYWPFYCDLIASPEPCVCVSQEKIMVSHQEIIAELSLGGRGSMALLQ